MLASLARPEESKFLSTNSNNCLLIATLCIECANNLRIHCNGKFKPCDKNLSLPGINEFSPALDYWQHFNIGP